LGCFWGPLSGGRAQDFACCLFQMTDAPASPSRSLKPAAVTDCHCQSPSTQCSEFWGQGRRKGPGRLRRSHCCTESILTGLAVTNNDLEQLPHTQALTMAGTSLMATLMEELWTSPQLPFTHASRCLGFPGHHGCHVVGI
jgi:hypothetical protein